MKNKKIGIAIIIAMVIGFIGLGIYEYKTDMSVIRISNERMDEVNTYITEYDQDGMNWFQIISENCKDDWEWTVVDNEYAVLYGTLNPYNNAEAPYVKVILKIDDDHHEVTNDSIYFRRDNGEEYTFHANSSDNVECAAFYASKLYIREIVGWSKGYFSGQDFEYCLDYFMGWYGDYRFSDINGHSETIPEVAEESVQQYYETDSFTEYSASEEECPAAIYTMDDLFNAEWNDYTISEILDGKEWEFYEEEDGHVFYVSAIGESAVTFTVDPSTGEVYKASVAVDSNVEEIDTDVCYDMIVYGYIPEGFNPYGELIPDYCEIKDVYVNYWATVETILYYLHDSTESTFEYEGVTYFTIGGETDNGNWVYMEISRYPDTAYIIDDCSMSQHPDWTNDNWCSAIVNGEW